MYKFKGLRGAIDWQSKNFCFCLACMQTVHIESLRVYLPIRVVMMVGFIWASCPCHSLVTGIVRVFRVDIILPAIDALDDSTGGSNVCCILRSAISTPGSELSLVLYVPFSVLDDRS